MYVQMNAITFNRLLHGEKPDYLVIKADNISDMSYNLLFELAKGLGYANYEIVVLADKHQYVLNRIKDEEDLKSEGTL